SSSMRVRTRCHRSLTRSNLGWPRNLPPSFFASSRPSPIPAHECTVVPPMLTDAIPVEAVIARP
ncbi:hypothetical protein DEU56DRAFT_745290, partial [Suillus clintonianus]|uniref:uncharacterized protein n=1 Tax=Suillus clintonianus TaxID=1904413 RepID=UPI001B878E79